MRKTAWFSTAAVLAVSLVLGLSTVTVPAQDKGEKHPHMQAALKQLGQVERQLERAAHDYGGHRAKALQLVKQAEQEIKEGIAYDEKNPAPKSTPKPKQ